MNPKQTCSVVHQSKLFYLAFGQNSKLFCLLGQIHFIDFGEEQSGWSARSHDREGADGSNSEELLHLYELGNTTIWVRITSTICKGQSEKPLSATSLSSLIELIWSFLWQERQLGVQKHLRILDVDKDPQPAFYYMKQDQQDCLNYLSTTINMYPNNWNQLITKTAVL